jgi:hypothetical protein
VTTGPNANNSGVPRIQAISKAPRQAQSKSLPTTLPKESSVSKQPVQKRTLDVMKRAQASKLYDSIKSVLNDDLAEQREADKQPKKSERKTVSAPQAREALQLEQKEPQEPDDAPDLPENTEEVELAAERAADRIERSRERQADTRAANEAFQEMTAEEAEDDHAEDIEDEAAERAAEENADEFMEEELKTRGDKGEEERKRRQQQEEEEEEEVDAIDEVAETRAVSRAPVDKGIGYTDNTLAELAQPQLPNLIATPVEANLEPPASSAPVLSVVQGAAAVSTGLEKGAANTVQANLGGTLGAVAPVAEKATDAASTIGLGVEKEAVPQPVTGTETGSQLGLAVEDKAGSETGLGVEVPEDKAEVELGLEDPGEATKDASAVKPGVEEPGDKKDAAVEDGQQTEEQKTEEQKTEEQKTEEQKAEEQKAEEQKAEEQKPEEQATDEQGGEEGRSEDEARHEEQRQETEERHRDAQEAVEEAEERATEIEREAYEKSIEADRATAEAESESWQAEIQQDKAKDEMEKAETRAEYLREQAAQTTDPEEAAMLLAEAEQALAQAQVVQADALKAKAEANIALSQANALKAETEAHMAQSEASLASLQEARSTAAEIGKSLEVDSSAADSGAAEVVADLGLEAVNTPVTSEIASVNLDGLKGKSEPEAKVQEIGLGVEPEVQAVNDVAVQDAENEVESVAEVVAEPGLQDESALPAGETPSDGIAQERAESAEFGGQKFAYADQKHAAGRKVKKSEAVVAALDDEVLVAEKQAEEATKAAETARGRALSAEMTTISAAGVASRRRQADELAKAAESKKEQSQLQAEQSRQVRKKVVVQRESEQTFERKEGAAEKRALKNQQAVDSPPQPTAQEPVKAQIQEPVVREPVKAQIQNPVVREPARAEVQKSVVREPAKAEVQKSVVREPASAEVQKSVVREPAKAEVQKSVVREPVKTEVQQSVAREPVKAQLQKPIVQEPVRAEVQKSIVREAAKAQASAVEKSAVGLTLEQPLEKEKPGEASAIKLGLESGKGAMLGDKSSVKLGVEAGQEAAGDASDVKLGVETGKEAMLGDKSGVKLGVEDPANKDAEVGLPVEKDAAAEDKSEVKPGVEDPADKDAKIGLPVEKEGEEKKASDESKPPAEREQTAEEAAEQEAEQKAKQEAEQKAKQEADQKANQEAEQKAKQEAEQKAAASKAEENLERETRQQERTEQRQERQKEAHQAVEQAEERAAESEKVAYEKAVEAEQAKASAENEQWQAELQEARAKDEMDKARADAQFLKERAALATDPEEAARLLSQAEIGMANAKILQADAFKAKATAKIAMSQASVLQAQTDAQMAQTKASLNSLEEARFAANRIGKEINAEAESAASSDDAEIQDDGEETSLGVDDSGGALDLGLPVALEPLPDVQVDTQKNAVPDLSVNPEVPFAQEGAIEEMASEVKELEAQEFVEVFGELDASAQRADGMDQELPPEATAARLGVSAGPVENKVTFAERKQDAGRQVKASEAVVEALDDEVLKAEREAEEADKAAQRARGHAFAAEVNTISTIGAASRKRQADELSKAAESKKDEIKNRAEQSRQVQEGVEVQKDRELALERTEDAVGKRADERTERQEAAQSQKPESAGAEPVRAEPVQPTAQEPVRTEPVRPIAQEPVRIEPVQPIAQEPVRTEPVQPIAQEPVKAQPVQPIAQEPVRTEPLRPIAQEPAKAQPVQPIAQEPVRATPVRPIAQEPVRAQPLQPIAQEPVRAQPVQPIAREPVGAEPLQPIAQEPVRTEPVRPIAEEPVRAQPVQPIAQEPVGLRPLQPIVDEPVRAEPVQPIAQEPVAFRPLQPIVDEPVNLQPLQPITSEPVNFQPLQPIAEEPVKARPLPSIAKEPLNFQPLQPISNDPVNVQPLPPITGEPIKSESLRPVADIPLHSIIEESQPLFRARKPGSVEPLVSRAEKPISPETPPSRPEEAISLEQPRVKAPRASFGGSVSAGKYAQSIRTGDSIQPPVASAEQFDSPRRTSERKPLKSESSTVQPFLGEPSFKSDRGPVVEAGMIESVEASKLEEQPVKRVFAQDDPLLRLLDAKPDDATSISTPFAAARPSPSPLRPKLEATGEETHTPPAIFRQRSMRAKKEAKELNSVELEAPIPRVETVSPVKPAIETAKFESPTQLRAEPQANQAPAPDMVEQADTFSERVQPEPVVGQDTALSSEQTQQILSQRKKRSDVDEPDFPFPSYVDDRVEVAKPGRTEIVKAVEAGKATRKALDENSGTRRRWDDDGDDGQTLFQRRQPEVVDGQENEIFLLNRRKTDPKPEASEGVLFRKRALEKNELPPPVTVWSKDANIPPKSTEELHQEEKIAKNTLVDLTTADLEVGEVEVAEDTSEVFAELEEVKEMDRVSVDNLMHGFKVETGRELVITDLKHLERERAERPEPEVPRPEKVVPTVLRPVQKQPELEAKIEDDPDGESDEAEDAPREVESKRPQSRIYRRRKSMESSGLAIPSPSAEATKKSGPEKDESIGEKTVKKMKGRAPRKRGRTGGGPKSKAGGGGGGRSQKSSSRPGGTKGGELKQKDRPKGNEAELAGQMSEKLDMDNGQKIDLIRLDLAEKPDERSGQDGSGGRSSACSTCGTDLPDAQAGNCPICAMAGQDIMALTKTNYRFAGSKLFATADSVVASTQAKTIIEKKMLTSVASLRYWPKIPGHKDILRLRAQ